jgi:ATP-dependent RNA circularization protein (DNA/RNA ligase family)
MVYYIFYNKTIDKYNIDDVNILGEKSFNNFWSNSGYDVLTRIINDGDEEVLEGIIIKRSDNKTIDIITFMEEIQGLTIIRRY